MCKMGIFNKFDGAKIIEVTMKWFKLFFLNRYFKKLLDSLAKILSGCGLILKCSLKKI